MEKKLTNNWLMIPERDKEKIKRLEHKEAKESVWRWRKKEEGGKVTKEEVRKVERIKRKKESEGRLEKLESILERVKEIE